MVFQIEDPRKSGAGKLGFIPGPIGLLCIEQIANSPRYGCRMGFTCCDQAEQCPSRLRCGGDPCSAQGRVVIAVGRFAPAATFLLMVFQPFGPLDDAGVTWANPIRDETHDDLPCSIKVVDTPAAIPAVVWLLIFPDKIQGALVDFAVGTDAQSGEAFEHTCGNVGGAGVNHRVMISERDLGEDFSRIVGIERAPAPVTALHRLQPANTPAHGMNHRRGRFEFGNRLLGSRRTPAEDHGAFGILDRTIVKQFHGPVLTNPFGKASSQGNQHHAGIIDIGVEFVVILEVPTPRFQFGVPQCPVTLLFDFF